MIGSQAVSADKEENIAAWNNAKNAQNKEDKKIVLHEKEIEKRRKIRQSDGAGDYPIVTCHQKPVGLSPWMPRSCPGSTAKTQADP